MLACYATLINRKLFMPSSRTQYVAVDYYQLHDFMKLALSKIEVESGWYLRSHRDVAEALAKGDAKDHYVTYGYYEHRMPYEIPVDADWYLAPYPDRGDAAGSGQIATARDHFDAAGFKEGRLPQAGFMFRGAG
jgi:hypothetical protein